MLSAKDAIINSMLQEIGVVVLGRLKTKTTTQLSAHLVEVENLNFIRVKGIE